MSHIILLSVPLFVFLGLLIEITGMARTMVGFLASLLGHVRGGLSLRAARRDVPRLRHLGLEGRRHGGGGAGAVPRDEGARRKARRPRRAALGDRRETETIPPSLVLITIGSVTGVSIAALFTGGLLPGLVLALALCAVVWWRYRDEDLRHVRRASAGQIGRALVVALPALALPFLIRAAVVEGVATATEVSTIGIAYSLAYGVIAAFVFRDRIDWRRLWPVLVDTACAVGRDPAHHRHRDRDGLGADPVRLLAPARRGDDRAAGRRRRPSWRCRSSPS